MILEIKDDDGNLISKDTNIDSLIYGATNKEYTIIGSKGPFSIEICDTIVSSIVGSTYQYLCKHIEELNKLHDNNERALEIPTLEKFMTNLHIKVNEYLEDYKFPNEIVDIPNIKTKDKDGNEINIVGIDRDFYMNWFLFGKGKKDE